jgi:hypothetical protein
MNNIDTEFLKLDDDDTCALLKPYVNVPPITKITEEIWEIMNKFPEIKHRIKVRLNKQ